MNTVARRRIFLHFFARKCAVLLISDEPHPFRQFTSVLTAIVKEAREKDGLAKIEFVHKRINDEIRYEPDPAQWGLPDHWSLPTDVDGKGSLNTGVGDCEDYALAKYLILLDARFPDKDLRILLVHDNFVKADHAVLAARLAHKWLILDNRFDRLYEDKDLKQFKPLMIVDTQGVHYLSKMFRIADAYDP